MLNELICRCGHSEYEHVEPLQKGVARWLIKSYPCTNANERGCCPCLDFHVAPRPKPQDKAKEQS